MSLEVANTLASYQLEIMLERIELISDLASTLCKGISEMVSNEKGSNDEQCMVIKNELDKVMVFIEADRETKKVIAQEWGHNIEQKAVDIWDKSSVKVVEISNTVGDAMDDFGHTVIDGTTESWKTITDGTTKAWDSVSTGTMNFEENVREGMQDSKIANAG